MYKPIFKNVSNTYQKDELLIPHWIQRLQQHMSKYATTVHINARGNGIDARVLHHCYSSPLFFAIIRVFFIFWDSL